MTLYRWLSFRVTQNYGSIEVSVCFEKDSVGNKKNKREATLLQKTWAAGFELPFDFESWGEDQEKFLLGQRFGNFHCLTHSKYL